MMEWISRRHLAIALAMLLTAGLSVVLSASSKAPRQAAKIDLEAIVPTHFAEWSSDQSSPLALPAPDVQESLQRIYSQTLMRTYVNTSGERIMLSIAYGDGLDKQLDVHRPEYCYPAQGFEVGAFKDLDMLSDYGGIPLRRLVARQGRRIEPISYWITIGGQSVSSTFLRKLHRIRRGLTGQADSGMLVRVSSINPDERAAFALQEQFIRAFVQSLPDKHRQLVVNTDAPR